MAATPALLADFRDLRARLQAEGLFASSKAFYAWKAASTLALGASAVAALAACGGAWPGAVGSAALLALFWQQCGWLAHDFLHHQVFADRRLNNAAGYVLGNVCQARRRSPLFPQCLSSVGREELLGDSNAHGGRASAVRVTRRPGAMAEQRALCPDTEGWSGGRGHDANPAASP